MNGRVLSETQALVGAATPAVLFGAGIFDTVKCGAAAGGQGEIYWLAEHVARFTGFCRELEIPIRRSPKEIAADARACLAANMELAGQPPPALKILATLRNEAAADVFVVVAERTAYPKEHYQKGVALSVALDRQNERSTLAGKKTLNYFERFLARREAKKKGILDWLYLDTAGHVSEGTFLNVFWVKRGAVRTPALSTGILSGITRSVVLSILKKENVRVEEGTWPLADLLGADEAFATSSVLEVAPVVRIGEGRIGRGRPGPFVRRLMRLYRAERSRRGTTRI